MTALLDVVSATAAASAAGAVVAGVRHLARAGELDHRLGHTPAPRPRSRRATWVRAVLALRRGRRTVAPSDLATFARAVADTLATGRALPNALVTGGDDVAGPLADAVADISQRLSVGVDVVDALHTWRRRAASEDVDVLVATIEVQYRSGGDLAGALRHLATVLDARQAVRDEVDTALTGARSGGRLTAAMGIGVLVLVVALDPSMPATLLASPLGRVALAVAATLNVVGSVAVRRIGAEPS